MSWTPVRCTGRRYPNAPVYARQGCLERQPGYWFLPFLSGFTGEWAVRNGQFLPARWAGFSPPTGYDVANNWNWTDPDDSRRLINVRTERNNPGDPWRLLLRVRYSAPLGFIEDNWAKEFPDGFPKWPNTYNLERTSAVPWIYGGTFVQAIYVGYYTQIAPNMCLT